MTIDQWNDWEAAGSDGQAENQTSPTTGGVDARERHKLAERERRKSMRELFLSLHSLLPHGKTVRKEQSAILDEIIKYIPLAAARLRSLQKQKDAPSSATASTASKGSPSVKVSSRDQSGGDCDIRVMPEPSSSVSIRVRGDRVNVSFTDTKGPSQTMLLSAVLDELESHQLMLVRSAHCRDGNKLLHHSESKVSRELCGHFQIKCGQNGIFVNNCRKASQHKDFRQIQFHASEYSFQAIRMYFEALSAVPGLGQGIKP